MNLFTMDAMLMPFAGFFFLNFGNFSSMLGNNPVELATKTGSVTPQGSTPGATKLAPIFDQFGNIIG